MTRKKLCTSLNLDARCTQASYEALSIPKFLIHFPIFPFFSLLQVYYEQTVDVESIHYNQYILYVFFDTCKL